MNVKPNPRSGTKLTNQHKLLKSDHFFYDTYWHPEHKKHTKIDPSNTNLELDARTPKLTLENKNRRVANPGNPIQEFTPILDKSKPYLDVWSDGDFFRGGNYQDMRIFYEQPYKDM